MTDNKRRTVNVLKPKTQKMAPWLLLHVKHRLFYSSLIVVTFHMGVTPTVPRDQNLPFLWCDRVTLCMAQNEKEAITKKTKKQKQACFFQTS